MRRYRATSKGRAWAVLAAMTMLPGCFYDPDYVYVPNSSTPSTYSTYSTSTPSAGTRERSYVSPNGDMYFKKPGETTVVRRDGSVTVVQRDRDGTRTVVGSGGVRVIPPGSGSSRRRY